jgi:hypothetical protein
VLPRQYIIIIYTLKKRKPRDVMQGGISYCVKATTVVVFYLQAAGSLGRYGGRPGNCTIVKNHGTVLQQNVA